MKSKKCTNKSCGAYGGNHPNGCLKYADIEGCDTYRAYRHEFEQSDSSVTNTLAQRSERYGEFHGHAAISQNIKRAMVNSPNWVTLSDDKKEALSMIAHKIARILNGDPEYADSWHDIAGYATLIEESLK